MNYANLTLRIRLNILEDMIKHLLKTKLMHIFPTSKQQNKSKRINELKVKIKTKTMLKRKKNSQRRGSDHKIS